MWKEKVLVTQSCPTLCDPIHYNLSGSSVHGILQARILEWVAILFSRISYQPREQIWVSCIAGTFFTIYITRKALNYKEVDMKSWDWENQRCIICPYNGAGVKNPPANAGDVGLIPGSERSPGEGSGNTLWYSCLENSMDRGAWQAYSPWGLKELNTTEWLTFTISHQQ